MVRTRPRVDLPKSNLRERRRRRRIVVAWLCVGAVVLVVAAMSGVTWLPFMRVHAINVTGQKTVPIESIETAAQKELYGGYLHLFARSNIFIYPKTAIRQQLLSQFPTFESVDVRAGGFRSLGVTVVERKPVALWCGLVVASTSSCYLLDQGGVVYAPAVVYSGDAYQKFYGVVSGATLPQQFLDSSRFHSLTTFVSALQTKQNIMASSIAVDLADDVRLRFTNGFEFIFALGDDSGDVFNRFDLALQSSPFKNHQLSDFDYLDLRFGDKMYYKLKAGAAKPDVATSSAH